MIIHYITVNEKDLTETFYMSCICFQMCTRRRCRQPWQSTKKERWRCRCLRRGGRLWSRAPWTPTHHQVKDTLNFHIWSQWTKMIILIISFHCLILTVCILWMNSDNTRSSAGFSIIPTNEKNQTKLKQQELCPCEAQTLRRKQKEIFVYYWYIKKKVYFYSTNTEAETVHFVWL